MHQQPLSSPLLLLACSLALPTTALCQNIGRSTRAPSSKARSVDLSVSHVTHDEPGAPDSVTFHFELRQTGLAGRPFVIQASDAHGCPPEFVARGTLGGEHRGQAWTTLDDRSLFEQIGVVRFRATVWSPAGLTHSGWQTAHGDPECEMLSFNYAPDSTTLPAGTMVDDEWASVGMNVSARSNRTNGTDQAILFDSGNPTGGDPDLQTPGYGANNDTALGNLLILAEDLVDSNNDMLVDDPDDDELGGTITFRFDRPVTACALGLIDLDKGGIGSRIRFYDAGNAQIDDLALPSLGDNSFQEVDFFIEEVSRIEVDFVSSGGIPFLRVIPCPATIDFDTNTFGVPREFEAGRMITDDLEALGVVASADNNDPSHPDVLTVFDTANPTGGDPDLQSPGYGPGNDTALGNILIIAEDAVNTNGDQLIDDPDDEVAGGTMRFDFPFEVTFESATVIDIDSDESGMFRLLDGAGNLLDTITLQPLGDNSVQTVTDEVGGIRRIELVLSSSGGLAELKVCPD